MYQLASRIPGAPPEVTSSASPSVHKRLVAAAPDHTSLQGTWPQVTQPTAADVSAREPGKCGLKFDDPRLAFAAHSNAQLLRGVAVFSTCSVKPLVMRAESGLRLAKRVFGRPTVNAAVRHTFFKHFCAGERRQRPPREHASASLLHSTSRNCPHLWPQHHAGTHVGSCCAAQQRYFTILPTSVRPCRSGFLLLCSYKDAR